MNKHTEKTGQLKKLKMIWGSVPNFPLAGSEQKPAFLLWSCWDLLLLDDDTDEEEGGDCEDSDFADNYDSEDDSGCDKK